MLRAYEEVLHARLNLSRKLNGNCHTPNDNALVEDKKELDSPTRDVNKRRRDLLIIKNHYPH